MSIASEITRLQGVKADILTAIGNKGVIVPAGSALDDCPGLIADITISENGSVKIGDLWYRTVKIGSQIWLGENLEYRDNNIALNPTGTPTESSCWDYRIDSNEYGHFGKKWSYLYNSAALEYLITNKDTIFPGWHVPTLTEWNELFNFAGGAVTIAGKMLKSSATWNAYGGTDDYGMTILPSGYRATDGGFDGGNRFAYYWSSSKQQDVEYIDILFPSDADRIWTGYLDDKVGASIRLVKDT